MPTLLDAALLSGRALLNPAPSSRRKNLADLTADADMLSKGITEAWGNLTTSTIQSTGS